MNKEARHRIVDEIVDAFIRAKLDLWNNQNERDMLPQVALFLDSGLLTAPQESVQEAVRLFGPDIPAAMSFVVQNRPRQRQHEPILGIAVVMDAYSRPAPEGEFDPSAYVRGDMQRDFETNPWTEVREALHVALFYKDVVGQYRSTACHVPYVVTDGGVMQFSDRVHADDEDHEPEGAIAEAMRKWVMS